MKMTKRELGRNLLLIIFGSAVFALGFDLFLDPNGFNCGGVSGVSMLIVYVVKADWLTVGILSFAINVPLFIMGYRSIGRYFFLTSLLGMTCNSVFFDLFLALPVPQVEPMIAAIFGGVMIGSGIGFVFLAGASTGGVDIVARLLKQKLRNFPIGKILLCMDLCTAVATGIVFHDLNNTLYSAVALFISSTVLDKVVYGLDYAKVALIISDRHEEISCVINTRMHRGVTLLYGKGYYSQADKTVLLTAVKRKQLAQLKEQVTAIDPDAFIILQDAQQVLGDGFKRYDRNEL